MRPSGGISLRLPPDPSLGRSDVWLWSVVLLDGENFEIGVEWHAVREHLFGRFARVWSADKRLDQDYITGLQLVHGSIPKEKFLSTFCELLARSKTQAKNGVLAVFVGNLTGASLRSGEVLGLGLHVGSR